MGVRVGGDVPFERLQAEFDAVLVAAGEMDAAAIARLGLPGTPQAIQVNRETFQTRWRGVFAGGGAIRKSRLAVRSVAEGRTAAASISQYLSGAAVTGIVEPFNHRLQAVAPTEVLRMASFVSADLRTAPTAGPVRGFTAEEARHEAERCLGCDCRKLADCRLRMYAEEYGAESGRFRGERRQIEIYRQQGGVIFEVGKCISCGICVQLTARAREPLGLTFIGRGFDVRIGVPFDRDISEGLQKVAEECVAACPTGALAFAERTLRSCSSFCAAPRCGAR